MFYHKPALFTRILNRTFSVFASFGLTPSGMVTIEIAGRRSGQTRANVVTLVEVDGARYLVSPRGQTEWVRNLRAANGELAIRHRRRRRFRAEELPAEQRAPVLKAYLKKTALATRQHFGLAPDAPIEEFERIAARHPAYRITEAG